jgi:hypothetical protein
MMGVYWLSYRDLSYKEAIEYGCDLLCLNDLIAYLLLFCLVLNEELTI